MSCSKFFITKIVCLKFNVSFHLEMHLLHSSDFDSVIHYGWRNYKKFKSNFQSPN